MKRIQLQGLLFVLIVILLSSCSIIKSSQNKIKNKYLSTETLKVMHYKLALQKLKNQYCHLNTIYGFNGAAIAEPEEIQLLQSLLDDYTEELSTGVHGHFNDNVLAHEMKCCTPGTDPESCPDDMCPCYFLSIDVDYIFSNESLIYLEIWSTEGTVIDTDDTLLTAANIASEKIKSSVYQYEISLDIVPVGVLHIVKFGVIDATTGGLNEYSSFISVH